MTGPVQPALSAELPPGTRLPSGLPRLQAGAHLVPEDGACLMEYVSVLAGAPFSDHPRCTDPILATVARLVNDSCTDAGRPLLTAFAPVLAGTGPGDARRTAAIVRAAVRSAHTAAGGTGLRRHLRRAASRYERVTGAGPRAAAARRLDRLYRLGGGRRHLEASVEALCALPEPQRDAALIATLAAAIAAASQVDDRCPHPRSGDPAADDPRLLSLGGAGSDVGSDVPRATRGGLTRAPSPAVRARSRTALVPDG